MKKGVYGLFKLLNISYKDKIKKRTIRREKKVYSKSDRAITLIALIVTIIVLLVFAGVIILNVMGN